MLYQLSYRPLGGKDRRDSSILTNLRTALQSLLGPTDLLFMDGSERRRERRTQWHGAVRLVIPGREPVEASIADISEIGCGMVTGRAVEPGAAVSIDGTGFYGSGIVRFCYPSQSGYRVGIELLPVR